ncbi:MAG: hypothetical protein GY765_21825, partial [bacterium]|nr:hypothetical protein [bacterium]
MKKNFIIVFVLLICCFTLPGLEEITLKDGLNLEEKMSKNAVFLKECAALELDREDDIGYFLDKKYGHILVVDTSTGKLVRTISSRGQGPAELQSPISMRLKGDKVYVLDGAGAVKIFSTKGKPIREFRLPIQPWDWTRIDVNKQGEIFLGYLDKNAKTMVTVYNEKGEKLRSLIDYTGENLAKAMRCASKYQYYMKLDKNENIILVYFLLRTIAKYDPKGNLLWEKDIENRILDKYAKNDSFKVDEKKFNMIRLIFDVEITERNDIVVGHAGGGCMYSPEGMQ